MDRRYDAAPGYECSEHREEEGEYDEGHVPFLEHALLLLDHDRVDEGRRCEPRHERRVLDRVPRPVSAPSELEVGPARPQQEPHTQEGPGEERPFTGVLYPFVPQLPAEQSAHAEGERHAHADVAKVKRHRVYGHVCVLEYGV